MSTERRLLALTEEIYDAAAGGTPWIAVERGLRGLLGAGTTTLLLGDHAAGRTDLLWREGFSDADIRLYQGHYRHVDLWTTRTAAAVATTLRQGGSPPIEVIIGGERRVPDAEYLRSEFYNDFGRARGLRHVIGTVVPLGEAGLMPVALHRPDGAPPFAETERRILGQAVPHLRRAMQLRHRLRDAAGTAGLAALDALATGVLAVDGEMRVVMANLRAEVLAGQPGAGIRLQRARLLAGGGEAGIRTVVAARHRAEDARLAALVRAVAAGQGEGGAVRLTAEDGTASLAVLVGPLPRRLATPGAEGGGRVPGQALLMLRDLSPRLPVPPRPALLRDLFGLSRAEAEVACALAGGATKEAVAGQRGLKPTTVRTQVRSILAKTGAANLRDLERVLAGLEAG